MWQELRMLDAAQEWEKLSSIVLVESGRTKADQPQQSSTYYISSLKGEPAKKYGEVIRGHWGIENGLHRQLDVTFGEDASKVSKDNGPQNLSTIRKLALHLLSSQESKMSMKRKRKKTARDNAFLLKVLENA